MIKIRNKRLIAKFIIVGTVGFFANYIVLEIALRTVTNSEPIAAIIAMAITINLTFYLHDKWTYIKPKTDYYMSIFKRYPSYLTTNSSGAVITIVLFSLLSNTLPNIIALGVAALTAMIWNFIMNLVVWRHHKEIVSNPSAFSELSEPE